MYLHKTPYILKALYPSLIWNKPRNKKTIYLTFDDGPIPEVTEFVLDILDQFKSEATFFCVGDNIRKHGDVYKSIIKKGHSTGNHTYNHLNGFKTESKIYFDNINKCHPLLESNFCNTNLFRPPYGRIRKSQVEVIKKNHQIIMWDVLSGDFDPTLSSENCLKASIKHSKPGSIIVFHDSIKTYSTIKYVLPRYLQHFKSLGYSFEQL